MRPFETRKSKGYVDKAGVYCFALLIRKRIMEMTTLIRMLVVIGKYILKLPRSITRSPGNFPGQGIFGEKCRKTPAITMIIPAIIKNFAIFNSINSEKRS